MPSDVEGEHTPPLSRKAEDQEERDLENRRRTLVAVLRHSDSAVELLHLVEVLELEAELAELAGGDRKRHRRIEAAQLQLDELRAVAEDGVVE